MSRRSKGPRLYWRAGRHSSAGKLSHFGVWVIKDGAVERSTGLGDGASEKQKEEALALYLAEKRVTTPIGLRDPAAIPIADVLAKYCADIVHDHARPEETLRRIGFLRDFWGEMTLADISGGICREYANQRASKNAARRELEDLRAAINYHRKEGLHDRIVTVLLPPKAKGREHWFEREQAAAAIWAAWRYKELQKGHETDKYPRRHIARFMVFARYMGTRAGVICATSIEPIRPKDRPWCDLRNGVFYGLPEIAQETKKRRQRVQIPGPLLAHLRRWQRRGQNYVVEWRGAPVERITKGHDAAIEGAGLDPRFTPHIWRHTVATWLMRAGKEPWMAAAFLGMSAETLIRTYGHHRPSDSAEVHGAL